MVYNVLRPSYLANDDLLSSHFRHSTVTQANDASITALSTSDAAFLMQLTVGSSKQLCKYTFWEIDLTQQRPNGSFRKDKYAVPLTLLGVA